MPCLQLGRAFTLDDADYFVFHTPYSKLVRKAVARLAYIDLLRRPSKAASLPDSTRALLELPREATYTDAAFEKEFRERSEELYRDKVLPSTTLPREIGNSYTASIYTALLSLLVNKGDDVVGKRVVFFSYGSGMAASMFSLRVTRSILDVARTDSVLSQLAQRVEATPVEYEAACRRREAVYGQPAFVPHASNEGLAEGVFYLTRVDELHRRSYARVQAVSLAEVESGEKGGEKGREKDPPAMVE